MILGFLRLGLFLFIVMLAVYLVLSGWSRGVRRDELAAEWDDEIQTGDRDEFIRLGLLEHSRSLRRRLILGVFIIPYFVIAVLVYVMNFQ